MVDDGAMLHLMIENTTTVSQFGWPLDQIDRTKSFTNVVRPGSWLLINTHLDTEAPSPLQDSRLVTCMHLRGASLFRSSSFVARFETVLAQAKPIGNTNREAAPNLFKDSGFVILIRGNHELPIAQ